MIDRALQALSDEQKIVIALSKSVSATLSLIASSIIIYKIHLRYKSSQSKSAVVTSSSLRSSKNDGKITTYHRMLFSISILDVIHSISSAFSTLLVPSYTNGTFAHGNTVTCTMQGALQQLTPTIVIYLAMLNTYFMLKIRYNIADSVIQSKYEIWFHAIPFLHFTSTAIIGLSLRIFGPLLLTELGCWLDSYCIVTNTCTRSGPIFYNHLDWWAWSFAYIWLFICVLIVSINAILIYTAIRTQERRNEQYFAAKLLHHSEGNFTRSSAFHPSGSSIGMDQSDSNFLSETMVARTKEETESGNGSNVTMQHIGTWMHTAGPLTEETKVELTQIDETEETSCTGEPTEMRNEVMEGDTHHTNAGGHHIYWDDTNDDDPHTIGTTISTTIPSISSMNRTHRRNHDRITTLQQQKQNHHNNIKNSRIAAVQSTLYITSALFTAFWILMPWVAYKLKVRSSWRFFFAWMVNIASPSQGIFNLFLYVRIHYSRLRETNPEWNRWKCVKTCLFSSSD